jgi:hypothetical protein
METIQDLEDLLELLEKHEVEYLILGGLSRLYRRSSPPSPSRPWMVVPGRKRSSHGW